MPCSRHSTAGSKEGAEAQEVREITQLGLDFAPVGDYSNIPRKEIRAMNNELLESLESKVGSLLEKYTALKEENTRLLEQNQQLLNEKEGLKSRVDAILDKLEAI